MKRFIIKNAFNDDIVVTDLGENFDKLQLYNKKKAISCYIITN